MTWAWMALGLFVQWFVLVRFPRRIGKGKLTKPMWHWPIVGASLPINVRMKQVFILIGASWAVLFGISDSLYVTAGFWLLIIALYFDDYLFGDDDGKRRWESVRNKVKWKMKLPEPAAAKQDTA